MIVKLDLLHLTGHEVKHKKAYIDERYVKTQKSI